MTIIFNTDDYIEDDGIYMAEDIGYLLEEYVRGTNGKIKGYVMVSERSSRYGAIGGNGAKGYKLVNISHLGRAILNTCSNADRIVGSVNDDGELFVQYFDHDGTHNAIVKRITKSTEERVNNLIDMGTYDEIMEYTEKMPTVKIKKSMAV